MTNRFNAHKNNKTKYGVSPLKSGYESGAELDVTVPPCGLEDVERALFNLFDRELPLQVGDPPQRVPVVFAAGEKWALLKKKRALRDKNNTLILPLVTIVRTALVQDQTIDVSGRGINQHSGEITIVRRLDKSDRDYQSLVNRLGIKNQGNVATNDDTTASPQLTTSRVLGDEARDGIIEQGGFLVGDKRNNVFETIVVPSPQFYTATYDVTIWTQHVQHMNQIIEQILASYLPQQQGWRIETPSGYWFLATVDGSTWSPENNFDDMATTERIVKQKFTLSVAAFLFASSAPGLPVPVKRYISSPSVSFDVVVTEFDTDTTQDEPLLGSDDPTLPIDPNKTNRRDQRDTRHGKLYVQNFEIVDENDPALSLLPRGSKPGTYKKITVNGKIKYVKISNSGETVMPSGTDFILD